jgi:predicted AAA+ superfamily ATPase
VAGAPADEERVNSALRRAPVVLVTGPRQAGKSTSRWLQHRWGGGGDVLEV